MLAGQAVAAADPLQLLSSEAGHTFNEPLLQLLRQLPFTILDNNNAVESTTAILGNDSLKPELLLLLQCTTTARCRHLLR